MVLTLVNYVEPALNDGLVAVPVSADLTNGNKVVYSNAIALIIRNTDGAAATLDVEITSNTDSNGFSKTISKTAIADGSEVYINFLSSEFEKDGHIEINYNTASGTSTAAEIAAVLFQSGVK